MKHNIEFISYDGRYPNLCRGELVIKVNGKEWKLNNCLASGGRIYFGPDWEANIEYGDWSVVSLPPELEPYRDEIEEVVNENIPNGCCGGCI